MGEKKNSTATKEDANDKQNTRTRTNDDDNHKNIPNEAIGQGKLYSPEHAIKVSSSNHLQRKQQEDVEKSSGDMMGVAADIKRQMGLMKDKVMEKLTAASVPSDALDNTRHFLESVVKDVTFAAHGLTKDALSRIKTHLVDLLPSLSPSLTTKMVDDAEEEAEGECEKEKEGKEQEDNKQRMKAAYASPASSFFANLAKPLSRL